MKRLIFDIETIGEDFDSMDQITREVLTKWIKSESKSEEEYEEALENLKNGLGFAPFTGEIVAIGTLDAETGKGGVYFQVPGKETLETEKDGVKLRPMSEREMLEKFWEIVGRYDEFITFNGRSFDVPFLMVRSARHNIRPSKNLMSNRYLSLQKSGAKHVDLYDQLSFYGTTRRKGNFHLWCRVFDIKSPKAEGVTGYDVNRLFKEGKFQEIAEYNIGDLRATKELFEKWEKFMRF